MSWKVTFRARLLQNNQVQVPKRIVEELQLWIGTRVDVGISTRIRFIMFKTSIKKRFRFTIPHLELAGDPTKPGDIVEVYLTKLDVPSPEGSTEPAAR